MSRISENRIEQLLDKVSDEQFDFQAVYDSIKIEQEVIFDYMNTQDVSFFTREERAYFEFVIQFIWLVLKEEDIQMHKLDKDIIADREDSIWGLMNDKFNMEQILNSLQMDENLAELLLDFLDDETTAEISDVGKEWIFVKAATITSLLTTS